MYAANEEAVPLFVALVGAATTGAGRQVAETLASVATLKTMGAVV